MAVVPLVGSAAATRGYVELGSGVGARFRHVRVRVRMARLLVGIVGSPLGKGGAGVVRSESAEEVMRKPNARALIDALVAAGGSASPGELSARSGVADRTRSKWLDRLRGCEPPLVAGAQPRPALTDAGWLFATAAGPELGVGVELDEAISQVWPTERHRAFVRLALSAAVARHHLRAVHPRGHLGFVAIGRTGTGKSEMARFVASALGVPWDRARVLLPAQTRGSVVMRREQGPDGWQVRPAEALGLPFVLFDEADDAERPVLQQALSCFQGEISGREEGVSIEYRPTPMLAGNTPGLGQSSALIGPWYVARCVVFDTWSLGDQAHDLSRRIEAFELAGGLRPLDLDRCRPPMPVLPESVREFIDWIPVAQVLSPEAFSSWRWRQGLQLCALGRAGLAADPSDVDLRLALLESVIDYLICAESTPGAVTQPGWSLDMSTVRTALGDGVDLQALEERLVGLRSDRASARAAVERRRRENLEISYEVERAGAEAAERYVLAARRLERVPEHVAAEAAGLRKVLRKAAADSRVARSLGRVGEISEAVAPSLSRAVELRNSVDAQKQALADAKRAQRAAVSEAAALKRHQDQRRTARQKELRGQRKQLHQLEVTVRGVAERRERSPFKAFQRIKLPNGDPLLRYQSSRRGRPTGAGLTGALERMAAASAPPGRWVCTFDRTIQYPGSPERCEALSSWGPSAERIVQSLHREISVLDQALKAELDRLSGNVSGLSSRAIGSEVPEWHA